MVEDELEPLVSVEGAARQHGFEAGGQHTRIQLAGRRRVRQQLGPPGEDERRREEIVQQLAHAVSLRRVRALAVARVAQHVPVSRGVSPRESCHLRALGDRLLCE